MNRTRRKPELLALGVAAWLASVSLLPSPRASLARTLPDDPRNASNTARADRDELLAHVDQLEQRLRARPAVDLEPLEARTLLALFAAEHALQLDELARVESTAGRGELAFSVRGTGTLEHWLAWLDVLDAQGLAPGVEHFRVERDAPGERAWRVTLRVTIGSIRSDGRVDGRTEGEAR